MTKTQALVVFLSVATARPAAARVECAIRGGVVVVALGPVPHRDGASAPRSATADRDADPWIALEARLSTHDVHGARAFAASRKGKEGDALRAYVERVLGSSGERTRDATAASHGAAAPGAAGTVDDVLAVVERAGVDRRLGRLAAARALYARSADLAERLGWTRRAAASLAMASRLALATGDRDGAVAAAERRVVDEDALDDARRSAAALGDLARLRLEAGQPTKAADLYERCVVKLAAAGDRGGESRAFVALAGAYAAMGNLPEVLDRGERALAGFEALRDDAGVATALAALGGVQQRFGRYARAVECLLAAERMYEDLADADHAARVRAMLAGAYASLGDTARAIEAGEKALASCRARGDREGEASALDALAGVDDDLSRGDDAGRKLRRALALREARGDRRSVARTLADLGALHVRAGDVDGARAPLDRALALADAVGDKAVVAAVTAEFGAIAAASGDHLAARAQWQRALESFDAAGDRAGAARVLGRLGSLALAEGRRGEALQILDRALRDARDLGAGRLLAATLGRVAEARLQGGEYARALDAAREAKTVLESLRSGLGDERGATAREPFADVYAVGALAAATLGQTDEVAEFLEAGRAGALLDALDTDAPRRASAVLDADRDLAVARDAERRAALAHGQAVDAGDGRAIAEAAEALAAARDAAKRACGRAQRLAQRGARLSPRPANLDEIQRDLGPGDALVLYGVVGAEGLALVACRESARVVRLGCVAEIAAACEALALDDPASRPSDALAALSKRVLEPLALPKETTRILVAPDGPLAYVPFALLDPSREVAYLPSGTTLTLLAESDRGPGEGVLALGDPDPDASLDAQALAALRGGSRSGAEAAAVGDTTLLGAHATVRGFLRAAAAHDGRWRAVHLACRARIDPDHPACCSVSLSPGDDGDGVLSALEVSRADIPADLVVLSACDTGRGRVVRGEGILGLTRAFMCAGAPRVLASLWKVDDDATRALMTAFYGRFGAGVPASRALREAQAVVRSEPKWAHPRFWGAWVLWGLPD